VSDGARNNIPLITSLPPNVSRHDARGKEIGADYQERCIESWHRAGFEPISVNSTSESYRHSVRMIPVSRDASAVTGRPNVFLADLLAVASNEAGGGPVVLMNADLLIRPGTALAANALELRPGEFIFSRRIDIDRPDQTNGMPGRLGCDFFAGHADDISGLPDGGMVFGAPWWDHYFPLMMFVQGCRIYQSEPAVLHLAHRAQWWDEWEELGHRFIAEVQARVANERFRSRLDDAIKRRSGHLLSDLRYSAWKRLPKNAAFERRRMLYRVLSASWSFLDEVAAPRTVMAQP
jgi:hypothetical protein